MSETKQDIALVKDSQNQTKFIIKTLLKRGEDFEHTVNCQDALRVVEANNFLYFAVFDGCSGGEESHFASSLFSKTFREVTSNMASHIDIAGGNLETNVRFIVHMISRKIAQAKNLLDLTIDELLATMVICGIDKKTHDCFICAFGDGFYSVNGEHHTILNTRFLTMESGDNRPDYLGYNLHLLQNFQEFERWFSQKSEIYFFKNVKTVTIASDGINTFKKSHLSKFDVDPIEFLINDETWIDNAIMLERKYNVLRKNHIINADDISIVRVKIENYD
jgi:serine/threonine protein phosphatase PrpC